MPTISTVHAQVGAFYTVLDLFKTFCNKLACDLDFADLDADMAQHLAQNANDAPAAAPVSERMHGAPAGEYQA